MIRQQCGWYASLQGSQTTGFCCIKSCRLSYFTDLQGSQTQVQHSSFRQRLVTLLIYKVLKLDGEIYAVCYGLVTLLIYKVLKRKDYDDVNDNCLVTLLIYKVLKRYRRTT